MSKATTERIFYIEWTLQKMWATGAKGIAEASSLL